MNLLVENENIISIVFFFSFFSERRMRSLFWPRETCSSFHKVHHQNHPEEKRKIAHLFLSHLFNHTEIALNFNLKNKNQNNQQFPTQNLKSKRKNGKIKLQIHDESPSNGGTDYASSSINSLHSF